MLLLVVMVYLLNACGDHESVSAKAIADSAGIRVVTFDRATLEAVAQWPIDSTPLVIGVRHGEEPYEFSTITDIYADDNAILVADLGAAEVRVFDTMGTFVTAVGRSGSGPGEFRRPTWIKRVAGDSVYIWDSSLARLTVLDPNYVLARSESPRLGSDSTSVIVEGALIDGRLLVNVRPRYGDRPSPGSIVDTPLQLFLSNVGDRADLKPIATVPGRPAYYSQDLRRLLLPFTATPAYAASGNVVFAGNGGHLEVRRYRPGHATPEAILRFPAGRAVTSEDMQRYLEDEVEEVPLDRQERFVALLQEAPHGEWVPPFDRIEVDVLGNLWLREFREPLDQTQTWLMVDTAFVSRGRVTVPARFDVMAITASRIYGRKRAEDDLNTVHAYTFRPK